MITKEIMHKRLDSLRLEQKQFIANANAVAGAIQDCEYWLGELEKPTPIEEQKTETVENPE